MSLPLPGLRGLVVALVLCVAVPAEAAEDFWNPVPGPALYRPDDLYGHINGGAELFLEFGFEILTVLKYEAGEVRYPVEMYQMADPQGALGIYLAKCGRETPHPELAFRHTAGRYQLMMVRDRFVFVISNPSGDEAGAEKIRTLAAQWSGMLQPDPDRDPLGALPAEGRVAGTERMARGPVALDPIVTLGPGDVLHLGGTHTALFARYRDATGAEHSRLQVTYPDAPTAAAAFAHLAANLDPHLTPLDTTPTRLVYRSHDDTFGEASVDGGMLVVRFGLQTEPPRSGVSP